MQWLKTVVVIPYLSRFLSIRNLRVTEMGDPGSGSLMRLQSVFDQVCNDLESLTGAGDLLPR